MTARMRRRYPAPAGLLLLALFATFAAAGCSPPAGNDNSGNTNQNDNSGGNTNDNTPGNGNDNTDNGNDNVSMTIIESTTFESLTIGADETVAVMNDAVITVTGDAVIDGQLEAGDSQLNLVVEGELTVNGTLASTSTGDSTGDTSAPLNEQPTGIYIVVGDGNVTLADSAVLQTDGNYVITDDADLLNSSPEEFYDEVEEIADDDLTTLVPLPPDNDAFADEQPNAVFSNFVRQSEQALPPINIGGIWPPAGAPVPPGDKPVVIFRFNGNRTLNLNGWNVNSPAAPTGNGADQSANPGNNAGGSKGKDGMRLNIWNNGGPINIVNNVVLNLPDGGDGGEATSVCANATGGNGGNSGNFRMTASGGIDLTGGTLTINPGRSGHGGNATVTQGAPGADGCPGETGDSSTATGGNGGDNKKRLLVKGNVAGVANLILGSVIAGNGGNATAEACDGGNGIICCDGGDGGAATASGGDGGDASLNVSGLTITTGDTIGGDGGLADATGGNGGDGGDCKFDDAGNGGGGGNATASAGDGGGATSTSTTGIAIGGDSPVATSTGGNGGNGGDSGFGIPGLGGDPGSGEANPGAAGEAAVPGVAEVAEPTDGNPGADGGQMAVTLYCLGFSFVMPSTPGEIIPPGPQLAPVFDESGEVQLGQMTVNFLDIEGAVYQRGGNPDHVGLDGGAAIDFQVSSLVLEDGQPGVIGGLRLAVLFANGVNNENPLIIQALDSEGQLIDEEQSFSVPENFTSVEDPEYVDALFPVDVSVATFRLIVPEVSFVTPFVVYLLDP
ncbi:MAG: hypothetical protein HJJLKODD_02486 [Phycisphaerae bacterium]|nr:hypothetical protein [Phycisphaerae bacterium]